MADDSEEERQNARYHQNQPYDESLDVPDPEEVDSFYSPSPVPGTSGLTRDPGGDRRSRGDTPPEVKMSEQSDEEFNSAEPSPKERNVMAMDKPPPRGAPPGQTDEDEETGSSDEDDDDDDDDDDEEGGTIEGAYDPADFEHLPVTPEIKELFQYITRYTPQTIDLDHKLKPFIPDFIPAVGDIDAFIKIPAPDNKPDTLGLTVLDEPCAKQSDPTVLDLQLRSISKETNLKQVKVKSIVEAEKNPKSIENWIDSISDLHRSKPPPNVHYTKNMPDIETLMQEWPPEFEELLKEVSLPSADIDCDLPTYIDMICAMLEIPVYKSKVQSLHVLFTLYSEFKNSQHFQSLAEENKLDNALKASGGRSEGAAAAYDDSDRLII